MREFGSIRQFIDFLETRRSVIRHEQRHGADEAGEILVKHAQAKIAHYQEAAGPFAAWKELSENTLYGGVTEEGHRYPGKYELGYAPPDNPLLRTGQLRGSIEHRASEHEVVIGSHDPVAHYQEFGTHMIPARSFIGATMFEHGHDAAKLIYRFVIAALTGNPRPMVRSQEHFDEE